MHDSDLGRAIGLAAYQHRNQVDKRGEPYILHPIRVMNAVRAAGFSEKFQIVAVLHDILEDTYVEASELSRFGKEVYEGVLAITRQYQDCPPGSTGLDEFGARAWGAPKETHWEYFQRCVLNPIGRVVKYYDTLDNMDPKRFNTATPIGRYAKVLTWYQEQAALELLRAEHGVVS